MDCSLPSSSVHGILQARILKWLPCPPPGDLPNLGIKPRYSALQVNSLPSEPPGKDLNKWIHGHRYPPHRRLKNRHFTQNSSIEIIRTHDSIFGLDNRVWVFAYAFVQKIFIKRPLCARCHGEQNRCSLYSCVAGSLVGNPHMKWTVT